MRTCGAHTARLDDLGASAQAKGTAATSHTTQQQQHLRMAKRRRNGAQRIAAEAAAKTAATAATAKAAAEPVAAAATQGGAKRKRRTISRDRPTKKFDHRGQELHANPSSFEEVPAAIRRRPKELKSEPAGDGSTQARASIAVGAAAQPGTCAACGWPGNVSAKLLAV